MRSCTKTPESTPRSSYKKLDMMVFREMIAVALIQNNLPYLFVEYEKIREAFLLYASPSIEFWSRNTAAMSLRFMRRRKRNLRKS